MTVSQPFSGLVALLLVGSVQAASIEDYVKVCSGDASKHLSAEVCGCIGEKAREGLSARGFDFFVAATEKDQARSSLLYRQLSPDEIMTATLISLRAPDECRRELGPAEHEPVYVEGSI